MSWAGLSKSIPRDIEEKDAAFIPEKMHIVGLGPQFHTHAKEISLSQLFL